MRLHRTPRAVLFALLFPCVAAGLLACGPSSSSNACTPKCSNRHCGGDGCGQTCGTCAEGKTCDSGGRCVPRNQAPAITSATSATFAAGTAGSFKVTATGYPAPTLSETGALPGGVAFDAATGVLSGTPAAGSGDSYALTFTATNGIGSDATQTFTLTVDQAPAITSASNATFAAGTAGTFTVTVTGYPGPTLSETGALPGGVTFDASTGVLSGTPAAGSNGTYPLTFTAINGIAPDATQHFVLMVPEAPTIVAATTGTFTVGLASTLTLSATGVPTPSLSETGALPSGVTFTDNGNGTAVLSGAPAAGSMGTYPLTFTATNGVAPDATQDCILTVNEAPAFTSAAVASFTTFTPGSFTITTTGDPGGAAMAISEVGALPSGVTFTDKHDGTATIAGTAALGTGGMYPLTITVDNGVVPAAKQSFDLVVQDYDDPTTKILISSPCDDSPMAHFELTNNATFPMTISYQDASGGQAGSVTLASLETQTIVFAKGSFVSFYYNGAFFKAQPTNDQTCAENPDPSMKIIVNGVCANTTTAVYNTQNNNDIDVELTAVAITSGNQVIYTVTTNSNKNLSMPDEESSFYYNNNVIMTIAPVKTWCQAAYIPPRISSVGICHDNNNAYYRVTNTDVVPVNLIWNNSTQQGTISLGVGQSEELETNDEPVNYYYQDRIFLTTNLPDTICSVAPAITSANSATFTAGTAGTFTVTATGYPTPTLSEAGALPSGVSFDTATGVLSGAPAAGSAGSFLLTFTATNGVAPDATQSFTLTVQATP